MVVQTVTMETTRITTSVQSSLTGTRVAGGTVSSADGGTGSDTGGSGGSAGASSSASNDSGDGGSASDEGGDDESADSGSQGSGAGAGNPNVLVDTSNVGSTTQQIDTPVTSSGNSSLWSGEDGLGGNE